MGSYSQENVNTAGAKLDTVPIQMTGPTVNVVDSTTTNIEIDWVALTSDADTGGSAITSYEVMYDQGTDNFITLTSTTDIFA